MAKTQKPKSVAQLMRTVEQLNQSKSAHKLRLTMIEIKEKDAIDKLSKALKSTPKPRSKPKASTTSTKKKTTLKSKKK